MLSKTFKMNSKDFTQYAHRYGLSVTYNPVAGLSSAYTMDGTLHDDVLTNKGTYTIKLNPTAPDVSKEILSAYRDTSIYLTVYDIATDTNRTILTKPGSAKVDVALVKQGNVEYWQLSDLIFIEK